MVLIIALLCLGLVGLAGYSRGPVRAAFSLFGLIFGALLAKPLSPLTEHLLPVIGLHHPMWSLFMPQVFALVVVLIIFKIFGGILHQKLELHYKYKKDDRLYFKWERFYKRLGFCVGMLNGAIYFFLLMLPIYVGGYFTSEADGANLPAAARIVNHLRADLHASNLDRVLAAHDPVPAEVYQAADIIDLVVRNPILEGRLVHYPPLLALGERKELQAIGSDLQLQQLLQSKASVSELLAQPKIQALVNNAEIIGSIRNLVGQDLSDLQDYLNTGKSAKYDGEKILGYWIINLRASLDEERTLNPTMQPRQIAALRTTFVPVITGLSITVTTENQVILKKQNPDTAESTAIAQGTWKQTADGYQISISGNKPDTTPITIQDDGKLLLPRSGHTLVFNKEM